ncbi:hypothetical protein ABEF95_004264 [Exophiala dermatitidis]
MPSSKLKIDPPLLNSACPWATTLEDIKALYDSPYTGAVTIRTSLLEGFSHDDSIHQYTFFVPGNNLFDHLFHLFHLTNHHQLKLAFLFL